MRRTRWDGRQALSRVPSAAMKRPALAVLLLTTAMLAACEDSSPGADHPWGGFPALPATVTVDETAPAIPESGALGRASLILSRVFHGAAEILVLEDGRQFRLPGPPEGWFGHWESAVLSPDGWWLGYRTGREAGDQSYLLRSLATGHTYTVVGTPAAWSPDSRWLLAREEYLTFAPEGVPKGVHRERLLDLRSGELKDVGNFYGGAVLPNGEAFSGFDDGSTGFTMLDGSGRQTHIEFGTDEPLCWCPALSAPVISPDGERVSLVLVQNPTDWNSPTPWGPEPEPSTEFVPPTEFERAVVVLDRATGTELRRTTFVLEGHPELVADRGTELLAHLTANDGIRQLASLDPVSGAVRVLNGPTDWDLIGPGARPQMIWAGGPPI